MIKYRTGGDVDAIELWINAFLNTKSSNHRSVDQLHQPKPSGKVQESEDWIGHIGIHGGRWAVAYKWIRGGKSPSGHVGNRQRECDQKQNKVT